MGGRMNIDEAALGSIVSNLHAGAKSLDQVARALPDAVDAGFSSDVANAALARIGKAALALAQQGDTMAAKVSSSKGDYTVTEEKAEDDVRTTGEHDREIRQKEQTPLERAEPESGDQEAKNQPPPTTETAPAPTPPPSPTG